MTADDVSFSSTILVVGRFFIYIYIDIIYMYKIHMYIFLAISHKKRSFQNFAIVTPFSGEREEVEEKQVNSL